MRFYLKSQAIHRFLQKKHSWSFKKLTHQFGMESIKSWNSLEYVVLMFPKKKKKNRNLLDWSALVVNKERTPVLGNTWGFFFSDLVWSSCWLLTEGSFSGLFFTLFSISYYLFKFWVEGFWTLLNLQPWRGLLCWRSLWLVGLLH